MKDSTGGLYPFLDRPAEDPAGVLAEVRRSTLAKAAEITALRSRLWAEHGEAAAIEGGDGEQREHQGGRKGPQDGV
jgi:hypothetical protein